MGKIYITYGHGGRDSGAVKGGRLEKDYNLRTGLAVAVYLRDAGHQVVEYRTTDTDYGRDSSERIIAVARMANESKADYFIDVHYNSSTGSGNGVECYYSVVDKGTGKAVAEQISKYIASLGFTNRGAKTKEGDGGKDYFGVIRRTNMPANLVECAFISSDTDMNHVDEIGVDAVAKAIARGICDVLGGSVPGESVPEPTPEPEAPTERHLKGTIITTSMNFCKEPCGEVIQTLPKGYYFTVLYDDNGWFCIDFAGTRGYVAIDDNYVKVEDFNTGEILYYGTPMSDSKPALSPTSPNSSSGANHSIVWDGEHDPAIAELQLILNNKGCGLTVDGIAGNNTYNAIKKYTIELNDRGELTKWTQRRLNKMGYNCGVADGFAEKPTMDGIANFQRAYRLGLGYLGGTDWYYVLK